MVGDSEVEQWGRDPDKSSVTVSTRASQSGNLVHRPRHGEGEDTALAGRRVHADTATILLTTRFQIEA
jgi:hypothetical protein